MSGVMHGAFGRVAVAGEAFGLVAIAGVVRACGRMMPAWVSWALRHLSGASSGVVTMRSALRPLLVWSRLP
eukprot:CAMPEP_0195084264 /NCGR_PEP_ID=MMETSP0448-20130528/24978_1 /TAXON_ID=66468 /ORGANISM="Heterocapsa triquestra, Strain CCMP 448" /LENGTH=70 /DNA_ID=CAMNT_0040117549 /DNA_START=148 /DNA_END=357 /DNA_ORIENTATION=+